MQRRLTDGETERIARAYDALLGFPPGLDNSATQSCRMLLHDMLTRGTTDGLPYVDPELTDEDARARPWVMCRDRKAADWQGPHVFAAKGGHFFYAFISKGGVVRPWNQCRHATSEEIAAAGLDTPDA
jgi:hypothetical protein